MNKSTWNLAAIIFTIVFGLCVQSYAADPFSFAVDQVRIVRASEPDLFFDDISPWKIIAGTAYELDNFLTLRDPGDEYGFQIGDFLYIAQESRVDLSNAFVGVEDEGGNFSITSTWDFETCIPGLNQAYSMETDIRNYDLIIRDEIIIRVHNVGHDVGQVIGLNQGLYIIFEKNTLRNDITQIDRQQFQIDEGDVSGNILLSLIFDDSENTIAGAFSLDSGNTFQSPFIPNSAIINQAIFSHWEFTAEAGEVQLISEPATIDIHPDTLNLKSKGNWITCYIELPQDHSPTDIDVSTVLLAVGNDTIASEMSPTEIGDYDSDGILDLMVKFDRQSVQEVCLVGLVEMSVRFKTYSEILFSGEDSVLVIDKGNRHISENQGSIIY